MKAMIKPSRRRGRSLAPCGRGQGEGLPFVGKDSSCVCRG